ncbi:MAG: class I SAM-dependent methyltransferase [Thermomicrobiales bacterium]
MSVSSQAGIDTSNYRKHTSSSKAQRMLIDRFHAKITKLITELAPTTLLDAGCGEGFVAEIFQKAMPDLRITGFDFHGPSVELAAGRNPHGSFTTGDIYDIKQADNSFDVVCCFEVLEHLHQPEKALKEMTRVAAKAVVFSVPHEPFFCLANAARGKNLDIRPRGSDPDHRNFWSRKAFGRFVAQKATIETLTGSFPWTICIARPTS